MDDPEGVKPGETGDGSPKAPDNSADLAHRENVADAISKAQASNDERAVKEAGEKGGLSGAFASRQGYYKHLLKGGAVKLPGGYMNRQAEMMWNSGVRLPLAAVDKARTMITNRLRPKATEAVPPTKS